MKTIEKIRTENVSVVLLALCCFFAGMVFGFLLSPVKKGMTIGSNNNFENSNNVGDKKKSKKKSKKEKNKDE